MAERAWFSGWRAALTCGLAAFAVTSCTVGGLVGGRCRDGLVVRDGVCGGALGGAGGIGTAGTGGASVGGAGGSIIGSGGSPSGGGLTSGKFRTTLSDATPADPSVTTGT